jgi:hypothetical protein
MSSDLASLVIGLRADVATLQSDLGKANALNARYAKQAEDTWTLSAARIGTAIGAGIVAAGAGFAALAKQSIDAADNFNKMSQKVGVSVESLSSLNVQAKLSDVSIDSLQGALAKLARNAADAASGSKQQAAAFQAMGVSLKDANGNLKSTEDILAAVSAKFATYGDSASKTALAQQLFGKSGAELIPLLNQLGTEGFGKAREEAEKYGAVISGETAAQAEVFNDNLTKLKLEFDGFTNAIVERALPGLVKLTSQFVESGSGLNAYASSADTAANALKGVVLGMIAAKEVITGLVTVVLGLGDVIGAAGDLFNGFARAVGNDLTAIGEAMRGNFAAAKEALSDAGNSLSEGWDAAAKRVRGAWSAVSTGIGDAVANTKTAYDDLFGSFSNVTGGAETTAGAIKKVNAPLVQSADSAAKAAKAHIQFSDALRQAGAALERIQSLSAGYQSDINDIVMRMEGADDAQIAYVHSLDDIAAAYQQLLELGPPTAEAVDAVGLATQRAQERMDLTRTFDSQREAMQRYQDELRKTADMWGNFADAVFDAVTKSGNFLKNLLANLKSVVEQMLKEWFRTQVIGLFTGGGGGGYGSLVSAGMGLISTGGGGASGGGMTSTASGNADLFGTAQQGYSLLQAGKTMWNGFSTGLSNFWNGSSGSIQMVNGYQVNMPGAGSAGYNGAYGGYGSGWGQALGIAGAAYAGYNRYQQGGALGGAAGGIAYGAGTYALGAGVASAAAGTGFAAGVGGAFAIPVIGWIAAAAMLVDMVSGGKLFGTDGKFNFGKQQTFIGQSGATTVAGYDVKGQQALFGGSTHSWHDLPVDQATQDAWNQFVTTLVNGNDNLAHTLGVEAGKIAAGEFDVTFDKKGNVKSSQSIFNGVTYNEDQQAFQMREAAETMLNTLENVSSGISGAVEKYRQNAEQLYAVVNQLANAAVYFQDGGKLLALGADQSLTALLKLAEGSQSFGESIDQTIQRLIQAQQQYDSFVGQFKPATNYVDDFEATLSGINQQMLANIKQANALAVAAGAAGASEEDLANIHNYAAQQAAAAIAALEASAQSLAFQLGITTVGSLQDVNSEIARLQAKAGQGAGAISGFGSAMQAAAQQATDAMNLLLGDLSPLNDQQKWQKALEGLRAGTATADQALQIARRLFGTGSDYTAAFNQVNAFSRGSGAITSSAGSGRAIGGNGLSATERERLSELLKQQSSLQEIATRQQYQTLAQQIAEIASAKGEDFQQVLEEMGINMADLEKGLGLSNDEALKAYIENIQSLKDDNGENTSSIVAVLNKIYNVLSGNTDNSTPGAFGHSGHGRPGDVGSGTFTPGSFGHSGHGFQTPNNRGTRQSPEYMRTR